MQVLKVLKDKKVKSEHKVRQVLKEHLLREHKVLKVLKVKKVK